MSVKPEENPINNRVSCCDPSRVVTNPLINSASIQGVSLRLTPG